MVSATPLNDTVYRLSRQLSRQFLLAYWQPHIVGLENVPAAGPVILAVNHPTMLDAFTMLALSPRRCWTLVSQAVLNIPLAGAWIRSIGIIPVLPQGDTLERARQCLGRGGCLVIFPEGMHSNRASLQSLRRGVGVLAKEPGVSVVPVALTGCASLCGRHTPWVRGGSIGVTFGAPLQARPEESVGGFLDRLGGIMQSMLDSPTPRPPLRTDLHYRVCQAIWVPVSWLIFLGLDHFRPDHRR
jgi:1-acyl-sn-glycerol-3-phosphate acyltransferase